MCADREAEDSDASPDNEIKNLPMFRILEWIKGAQKFLDFPHVLMSPGNQDIPRTIVRPNRISDALGSFARAMGVDFETEIICEREDGHVRSSVLSICETEYN
jgi:hypothetical protein